MTYRVEDTALERVFELLAEEGFDGMSQALEVLLNEMMKVERSRHLQAAPYERSAQRQGYANGFKAKRSGFGPELASWIWRCLRRERATFIPVVWRRA